MIERVSSYVCYQAAATKVQAVIRGGAQRKRNDELDNITKWDDGTSVLKEDGTTTTDTEPKTIENKSSNDDNSEQKTDDAATAEQVRALEEGCLIKHEPVTGIMC